MKKHFPLILLLACLAVFALGVIQLFKLRFEAGDVYPEYSSLRADPLGTMALYESLEKVPGMSVRRDYSDANRLPEGKAVTYLHLAGSPYEWRWMSEELFQEIEHFLARGGRLVITMFPKSATYSPFDRLGEDFPERDPDKEKKKDETSPAEKKPDSKSKDDQAKEAKDKDKKSPVPAKPKGRSRKKMLDDKRGAVSVAERWGLEFNVISLAQGGGDAYDASSVTNRTDLRLPAKLEWHSGIVFTNLNPAWRVIYARGTNAVVVERKFGHGTVAIATDSFFVSNEALAKDRHADLLVWLVGSGGNVVFDEAHLGVVEGSGVAILMRKYRLHGLALGLAVLAGLFIWKNTVSLVPAHADQARGDYVAGKTAAAGFVNLLRRNISPRDLLGACFAEWKRSAAPTGQYSAGRLKQAEIIFQAEAALPVRDRRPIQAYRAICEILRRQTREPATAKPEQEQEQAAVDRKANETTATTLPSKPGAPDT